VGEYYYETSEEALMRKGALIHPFPQLWDTGVAWDGVLQEAPWQSFDGEGGYDFEYTWQDILRLRRQPSVVVGRTILASTIISPPWSIEVDPKETWANFILKAHDEGKVDISRTERMLRDVVLPLRKYFERIAFNVIDFGFSPHLKEWKRLRDGTYCIKGLKNLLPQTTEVLVNERTGDFDGLRAYSYDNSKNIGPFTWPYARTGNAGPPWIDYDRIVCALFNIDVEGQNWYGQSVVSNARYPVKIWENTMADLAKYQGKLAGSRMILRFPPGFTLIEGQQVDNRELALSLAEKLEQNHIICLPNGTDKSLETLMVGGQGGGEVNPWGLESSNGEIAIQRSDYLSMLEYCDQQIMRSLGIPERVALEAAYGSRADSEQHTESFLTTMQARLNGLIDSWNQHITWPTIEANQPGGIELSSIMRVSAAPVTNAAVDYLRQLYSSYIGGSEEANLRESGMVDWAAVRQRGGIPSRVYKDFDTPKPVAPETDVSEEVQ